LHNKLTFEVIKVLDKSKTTGAAKLPGVSATGNTSPRPQKAVLIIGGGIGGCMAAWKAAENGWDVTIIERGSDLLLGSSNQTPGRMGLGFHYSDVDTAKRLLRATINFVKEFPGFERGRHKPANHPVKNGRYYVVKESLVEVDGISDTYWALVNYYQGLVKEDKANKIYGDPKRFLRV
jgi:choline dehydrogenase-like flavoprotein